MPYNAMLGNEHSRRQFIKNGLLSLIALPIAHRALISRSEQVIVQLEGRANDLREEVVSFGLPLPFGFLNDPREVRVLGEDGTELVAAVRSLEPWRTGGREGSIRSVLIQFKADFSARKTQRVTVRFGRRARRTEATVVAVAKTLIDQSGLSGPRVQALLPADWMCASRIVGPQTPVALSGEFFSYDRFVEKNFPGSLAYLDSQVYHEWLFDRTSCYYKMYARTGEPKYLEAAYHAANFVREPSHATNQGVRLDGSTRCCISDRTGPKSCTVLPIRRPSN